MLKCCSLYSGSSGNSFLVQTEDSTILIDAGVSCKKIESALDSFSIDPKKIDAIFITHEHIDHTKSIGMLATKYQLPIYCNKETWNSLTSNNKKFESINVNIFENDAIFDFNDLKIYPFSTPHDAANPCGFNIFKNNKKISIATDLGHVSPSVIKALENSSFLMIEANYDSNILKYSSYPYQLKQRISGPNGHLENSLSGKTISELVTGGLDKALLIHLSKENNFPELAHKTVIEELQKNNISENNISVQIAPRDLPSPMFEVG